MPTSFSSYDIDGDGMISADEWSQYYPDGGGPAGGRGGATPSPLQTQAGPNQDGPYYPNGKPQQDAPAAPFDINAFIAKMSSGDFTDDDLMAFSNWYMGQQIGQQAGQLDYANRKLDYDLKALGLSDRQIDVALQEIEFKQGPYWDWYVNDYFPHQKQRDQMDYDLAVYNLDTQKALGEIEKGKAKDYALGQFYGTQQAELGADAARWNYMQMIQTPRQNPGRNLGGY